jgi:hypothetical protein
MRGKKNILLLEESLRNRYMSFLVEKNRTCLVEIVSFIALEILSFHGRGKMFIYMSHVRLDCWNRHA